MLKNVRFVLVGTTHPGNIGAAARAMKNMCLERLFLVNPQHYPDAEATARASGADDLLQRAVVRSSLDEALIGCRFVVGSSARLRSLEWPQIPPRECAANLLKEAAMGEVALVFGRESSGLSNEELSRCHYLVHIPANPDYSSLNLSQAVGVLAYELNMAAQLGEDKAQGTQVRASVTAEEMEGLFLHLEQTLEEIGFSNPQQSETLHLRLRRLFLRARPDLEEINILRGVLSAAQKRKNDTKSS